MQLRPASSYVKVLRAALPAETFAPARSRMLWLPVHLAIIVALVALVRAGIPWFALPVVAIVLGVSFAGLTFLGHETLHGGVVRGRRIKRVVGWIGFAPFVVSPTLWCAWHNREHHAHTNHAGVDPDAYPTLPEYQGSRVVQVVTRLFALGGRRWSGVLSLLLGFTGQSLQVLVRARRIGYLSKRAHRIAITETLAGVAVWTAVAFLVGPIGFVFAYVVPLLVANWIVMAFILTNHSLSPLGVTNDPLANSLSVTVPRLCEWLSLGFGHHVEHHLFPAMSTRHAPAVRAVLDARWPGHYQSMPLGRALLALHRSARVYADDVTLVDPPSGRTWPTLRPRAQMPT